MSPNCRSTGCITARISITFGHVDWFYRVILSNYQASSVTLLGEAGKLEMRPVSRCHRDMTA
eukprot:scaffold22303_cov176-Skeletonema_marinoi.AAC.1